MNTTKLNTLFNGQTTDEAVKEKNRTLAGTQQLTQLASKLAQQIMENAEADMELHGQSIIESKTSTRALDSLVHTWINIDGVLTDEDIAFLRASDDATVTSMQKSQQSKRSRMKKVLETADTVENYMSLLTAACAEHVIRKAFNKTKTIGTSRRGGNAITYTDEELQDLMLDQERVRREIRNVQSKISIYKRKNADQDEELRIADPHWQALQTAYAQLKDIRTNLDGHQRLSAVKVTKQLEHILEELQDIDKLKVTEAREALKAIEALIKGESVEDNEEDENNEEAN